MDNSNLENEKKPFYKKWWFWVIVVLAVILIGGALTNDTEEGEKDDTGQEQTKDPTLGAEEPEITDDTDVIEDTGDSDMTDGQQNEEIVEDNMADKELSRDNASAVLTTLNTGKFEVGTDIPEGRYVITGDGSGNIFVYDENDVPYVNEILGGGDFGVESVTTDIKTGDKVEISGISNVMFTPAETEMYEDTLTTGNWVVGLDIAPGRYDITSEGGSGNLFIYNTTGWIEVNEILGGGDFGVEKVTAELKEGYTITISGINQVNFALK